MRLTPAQIAVMRESTALLAGSVAGAWLFGSRVHDDARGGDVDLLLDVDEAVNNPTQLSAKLATPVSKSMHGRKVDVLIKATNLQPLPIHIVAMAERIQL